ncbi:hypothetical protein GCM10010371_33030 [Streptomyces subrutilus]|uniref:Uncharacterized protein n=1 Tax=Streptomyces subrutilus TaxID=36818 RepID=A0A918QT98_9ACTN|nr:hypothetical protein GCM10010371_33030 [Streptomyces subrutilus]
MGLRNNAFLRDGRIPRPIRQTRRTGGRFGEQRAVRATKAFTGFVPPPPPRTMGPAPTTGVATFPSGRPHRPLVLKNHRRVRAAPARPSVPGGSPSARRRTRPAAGRA